MYISVMFKDKNKTFKGKEYDYELFKDDETPKVGSIIRMLDEDYDPVCYGTRVKVTAIKKTSVAAKIKIHYIEATLD